MKQQNARLNNTSVQNNFSGNYSARSDYRERRRLNMKKRLVVLHYRRDRLERELQAINSALLQLDGQIQRDGAYEQLTMCE